MMIYNHLQPNIKNTVKFDEKTQVDGTKPNIFQKTGFIQLILARKLIFKWHKFKG